MESEELEERAVGWGFFFSGFRLCTCCTFILWMFQIFCFLKQCASERNWWYFFWQHYEEEGVYLILLDFIFTRIRASVSVTDRKLSWEAETQSESWYWIVQRLWHIIFTLRVYRNFFL